MNDCPWWRYELTVEEKHKNETRKDLTMGSKNECVALCFSISYHLCVCSTMYIKKQSTCYNVFIAIAMQNPDLFGKDLSHLIYDCSRTLYSKNKLPIADEDEVVSDYGIGGT